MIKIKSSNLTTKSIIMYSICFFLLLGIIIGTIYANNLNDEQNSSLGQFITGFFNSFDKNLIFQKPVFLQSLLKYGKYIIIIWAMGYIPQGFIVVILMLVFKGITYGFTTSLIVKSFGMYGFVIGFSSYFLQNIIFLPVMFIVSYYSIIKILYKVKENNSPAKEHNNGLTTEYIIIFLIACASVIVVSLIETYLVPSIFQYFISF